MLNLEKLNLQVADDFDAVNRFLENQTAQQRVAWAIENLPGEFALSSSFGVQSAVSLHLLTQIKPDIPVLLVDTGYLFPETYQFVEQLTERLDLNLHVLRPKVSSAWQEARFGRLWEKGLDGLNQYNQMNKVQPMEDGLSERNVSTWFAGIMRSQSDTRKRINVVQKIRGRYKVHPLIDWNNRKVHQYLKAHDLPYHPLWEKGYVSIGDTHSTVPLSLGMSESDTRFGGLKRECGLHEETSSSL
ncbi:phosphoadenylyl-sulfate reductase [Aliikangiella marina]|uniref:Phosphoadenosine 5'-phosphosulfate reductase n=1 Tax=Aliikangiella marina TaxID=1712262 RepID=A0A545THM2_9GAMM|nr:phosphoadenylyl-sulfate reductase [Aliikangiella marina]TQV76705.1 phosphoadenylyl-sulfate reductase [Aliikangiella marina]